MQTAMCGFKQLRYEWEQPHSDRISYRHERIYRPIGGAAIRNMQLIETAELERLVDDPEIRRAAAKTLKGFCLTYLPHHFPLELDEMCQAPEDFALKRVEMIGFRGCAKSTLASLALPLWAALDRQLFWRSALNGRPSSAATS